ncbi:cupin domain-containing protein [Xylophilus rhododendri]|uniref:Cupin domain-containing protein n=1 Tax=Xylophilus rhododendri TaxID=2697032 RepID=A0A857J3M1_9BURK|nr:cupin domain-containing protein [Xylophilus rhododendri]QHI97478.1 cupin domain-containing protein [Xylophilus rhododendri]
MNHPADLPSLATRHCFSMRNLPLLDGGATMELLGLSPMLWAHSKVYSTGGENALHCHDTEDHVFLILQGEASFHFGDGSSAEVKAFEGVMVPHGTLYRFHAHEAAGNLVMFRVGAALVKDSSDLHPKFNIPKEALQNRSDSSGRAAPGDAKANGVAAQPTVFRPGAFFAPD